MQIVAVCLGLGWLVAACAQAGIIPPVESGDTIKLDRAPGLVYDSGGPFRVDNLTSGETNVLTTFCMERDEYISFGTPYRAELGTVALLGGKNTDTGDPLDSRTAYLFSNFYHGTNGAASWSTADLQETIWYIEEELLPTHTLSTGAQALYNIATGVQHHDSLYDVRVMNLYSSTGGHCQSMLTVVPEPATVVLWSICGVCGLIMLHRRRKSA
jgi:hypothetical protein